MIRFKDAPAYLGMDRNRFNAEVRPYVTEIRPGKQGIAFDRLDLDAWWDDYKSRNGRPGRSVTGGLTWDKRKHRALSNVTGSGTSTNSTGDGAFAKAQEHLTRKLEEARQAAVFGVRPARTFREAATKYLNENLHKRSVRDDALHLKQLDPYIGALPLESVHMGMLGAFVADQRKQGAKTRTINMALQVVRHILNMAASEWLDEYNLTCLHSPPKIKLFRIEDARDPHPLSWEEQERLFRKLPGHLAYMALFKVNTGCREQEVCRLRWEREQPMPDLNTSVFIIPAAYVKNRLKRVVVLNRIAQSVIEAQRGRHPEFVFTFRGHPIAKMNNTAWQDARTRRLAGRARARPETYLRPTVAQRGGELRGLPGFVGAQVGAYHRPRLGTGNRQPREGSQQGLQGGVPQESRRRFCGERHDSGSFCKLLIFIVLLVGRAGFEPATT